MMEFTPGIYKIISNKQAHKLNVFKKDGQVYFTIDHGLPETIASLEHIAIDKIEPWAANKSIKNAVITISFRDEKGDLFELSCRNVHVLRSIFQTFPEIKSAFGSLYD